MAEYNETQKLLKKINDLMDTRGDLMEQLGRSLTIQNFWPEAFEHGRVKTYILGGAASGYTFTIERGDGSKQAWPIEKVPPTLWEGFRNTCQCGGQGLGHSNWCPVRKYREWGK